MPDRSMSAVDTIKEDLESLGVQFDVVMPIGWPCAMIPVDSCKQEFEMITATRECDLYEPALKKLSDQASRQQWQATMERDTLWAFRGRYLEEVYGYAAAMDDRRENIDPCTHANRRG